MELSLKEMLEVGAHFGHQRSRWNPKMRPYIYGEKGGIHIIDLSRTVLLTQTACAFLTSLIAHGQTVLFVGTKKQAQGIIAEEAKRAGVFYVTDRWLGGTLTNFKTIRANVERLKGIEKRKEVGEFEKLTKKEVLQLEREMTKILRSVGGIREMEQLPGAIFIVDPSHEHIAKKEAVRLGIPIVALIDTNCDPQGIEYVIPANDDAVKSIRYFVGKVADACAEGMAERVQVMRERAIEQQEAPESQGREARTGGPGVAFTARETRKEAPPEPVADDVYRATPDELDEDAGDAGKSGGV